MRAALVRDHLALLLLALLGSGPGHGYGLIVELRRRSSGFLNLPEGSIYPALHRLEAARLVRSRPADRGGRRAADLRHHGPGEEGAGKAEARLVAIRRRSRGRLARGQDSLLRGLEGTSGRLSEPGILCPGLYGRPADPLRRFVGDDHGRGVVAITRSSNPVSPAMSPTTKSARSA